jgi:cobalt-zinc-cadmium efflux system outer membrane protein
MLAVLAIAAGLALPSPAPPPLTLAQAIAQARAGSPLRAAPQSLILGTTEAAERAGRRLNPFIDVRVENLNWAGSTLPKDVFAVIGQPIELGGKRDLRVAVANADRAVAGGSLQVVHWQIALRTAQLYIQALKARGVLETLTTSRDDLATLIATMRRRVDEGYTAESDLLKFETESARMGIDIARSELDLRRSLNTLSYTMGASTPVDAAQLVEPAPVAPPTLDAGGIAAAVVRHPEVLAATARVERARQVSALERARRIPDPIVTAGYKRTAGFDTVLAGVTLSLPLFEKNGSAAARTAGEASAAAAERDALAGRLASEAGTLITVAQTLTDRSLRAGRELLEPADTVRNAARSSFREGTTDVLRLLDAERVHGEVRRTALALRLDALAASLEARFALGLETLP